MNNHRKSVVVTKYYRFTFCGKTTKLNIIQYGHLLTWSATLKYFVHFSIITQRTYTYAKTKNYCISAGTLMRKQRTTACHPASLMLHQRIIACHFVSLMLKQITIACHSVWLMLKQGTITHQLASPMLKQRYVAGDTQWPCLYGDGPESYFLFHSRGSGTSKNSNNRDNNKTPLK